MKKAFLLFLIFFPFFGYSQDTIVKRNGVKVTGKVVEVWTDIIKYTNPGTDGPLYVLRSSEISAIIYANGKKEVINPPTENQNGPFGSMMHKHMIGLNTIDLTFGLLSFTYETNLAGGKFALRIPVSTGVAAWATDKSYSYNDVLYYNRYKYFSAGFDFLYYPLGQAHTLSYYTGIATETGYVRQGVYFYEDFPPYGSHMTRVWYGGAGVTNGVLINVNERINVSAYVTLGMKYRTSGYYYNSLTMCRAGMTMGFRLGKPTVKS